MATVATGPGQVQRFLSCDLSTGLHTCDLGIGFHRGNRNKPRQFSVSSDITTFRAPLLAALSEIESLHFPPLSSPLHHNFTALTTCLFVYHNISTIEGWLLRFIHCFICLADINAVNEKRCLPYQETKDVSVIKPSATAVSPSGAPSGDLRGRNAGYGPYIDQVHIKGTVSVSPDSHIFPYREKC